LFFGLGEATLAPDMKSDLDHLPQAKRREIAFVVDLLRKGFAFAIARRTMPRLRGGKLLKIPERLLWIRQVGTAPSLPCRFSKQTEAIGQVTLDCTPFMRPG
jgi:hypothetical protein